jgi:hypothetical protein
VRDERHQVVVGVPVGVLVVRRPGRFQGLLAVAPRSARSRGLSSVRLCAAKDGYARCRLLSGVTLAIGVRPKESALYRRTSASPSRCQVKWGLPSSRAKTRPARSGSCSASLQSAIGGRVWLLRYPLTAAR